QSGRSACLCRLVLGRSAWADLQGAGARPSSGREGQFLPEFGGDGQTMLYLIEQCLNGIQLGMLLFLLAAGLTLIFGIMDLVNLAHGSLYMLGAYFAATFAALTDSFLAGIGLA